MISAVDEAKYTRQNLAYIFLHLSWREKTVAKRPGSLVYMYVKYVVNVVLIKLRPQTVSVQVQPVSYQSQTGHDPHSYNPVNYQRH